MPRIHCSQCGQAGHNKRNRNCPVNLQRESVFTETTLETRERSKQCREHLNLAVDSLMILELSIEQYRSHLTTPTVFVVSSIEEMELFCNKINRALEFDNPTRPLIRPQHLLAHLSTIIESFNTIFAQSRLRMKALYEDRKFSVEFITVGPAPVRVNRKRASAYLKEVALVQDTAIEDQVLCECPLCFDEFDAASVIVTNCKHSFCAPCIKGYSTAIKDTTKKPNCPMCRTDITEFKMGKVDIYEEIRGHLLNL